jgi:dTDP-4-dehydrorhamnose 3,5-epimerase
MASFRDDSRNFLRGDEMKFIETPLKGAYLIDLEKHGDNRGFFGRMFCIDEFIKHGLDGRMVQANNSFSSEEGTLRGLHYQLPPKSETKLVRCIKGSFYDVILDLRLESNTFGHSFGAILSEENRRMMYVPKGFAHGFLTLEENSEVIYLVSEFYSKELERGIRWDDPKFKIQWPELPKIVSSRDQNHPNFDSELHLSTALSKAYP